jgi:ABC-2 type transport system permease protein
VSGRRVIWEVARRELVERSRSRVMRVSVVLLLVLSIGGAVAAARLTGRIPTDHIALVGARSVAMEPAIQLQAKQAGRRARLHPSASATAASHLLRDGKVDVALIDGTRILVKSSRSQPAVRIVQDAAAGQHALDRLRSSGLSATQALAVLSPQPLPIAVLEPNTRNTDRNRGLILIGLLGLFMVLIFYGQAVAQGVTEEKSSRVVELLLTTVTPRRLLTGKVLGIGLLGLAQLVLAGGAALLAGRLAGGAGLPSAAPTTVALVLLWFVLGYAFYSVAFAAVGALVSRQEDLSTAMVPITLVMTASFYLALIIANGNPDGTLAQISAFVPPFAPMVVPARMVLGDMTALELALAVAVDLIATAGLIVLAGRIYERAILRMGAPVKLRRLFALGSGRAHVDGVAADRNGHALDIAGRIVGIALLLCGAAIGFGKPLSIALVLAGLLLVLALERRKRQPPRPGKA